MNFLILFKVTLHLSFISVWSNDDEAEFITEILPYSLPFETFSSVKYICQRLRFYFWAKAFPMIMLLVCVISLMIYYDHWWDRVFLPIEGFPSLPLYKIYLSKYFSRHSYLENFQDFSALDVSSLFPTCLLWHTIWGN